MGPRGGGGAREQASEPGAIRRLWPSRLAGAWTRVLGTGTSVFKAGAEARIIAQGLVEPTAVWGDLTALTLVHAFKFLDLVFSLARSAFFSLLVLMLFRVVSAK